MQTNPLNKREKFAVSLRKQKRVEKIKRKKIEFKE